jgi:hypothetical protein
MNGKQMLFRKMRQIVLLEKRPFTYKELEIFNLNGKAYSFANGTVRNVCSQLRKEGRIELVYRSPQAFLTIKGVKFEKGMTPNYRGVAINNTIQKYLKLFKIHKLDYPAIHDIRLKFYSDKILERLKSTNSKLIVSIDAHNNKDTVLKDIIIDNIKIKSTIHNTGTISVMIACSDNPIPFDIYGLTKLSSCLTRVEERLISEMEDYFSVNSKDRCDALLYHDNELIPYHMNWIVTMWHFGQDSLVLKTTGLDFDLTVKELTDLCHVYSKKRKVERIK